jgi:hypothetical protein
MSFSQFARRALHLAAAGLVLVLVAVPVQVDHHVQNPQRLL